MPDKRFDKHRPLVRTDFDIQADYIAEADYTVVEVVDYIEVVDCTGAAEAADYTEAIAAVVVAAEEAAFAVGAVVLVEPAGWVVYSLEAHSPEEYNPGREALGAGCVKVGQAD